MIRKIIFFFLILIFVQCSSDPEVRGFRTISIEPVDQPISLDSIFESYEIFKIDDIILGRISNVQEINNSLLIRAVQDTFGLIIHNKDNSFSKGIAPKGRGPGEFWVVGFPESSKDGFYVPDRMMDKVVEFDASGNIIQTIKIPYLFEGIILEHYPKLYMYKSFGNEEEGVQDFKISVINMEDESVLEEFIRIDNKLALERSIGRGYSMSVVKDTVVLCQALCDTIYNIFETEIAPRYIIETGGRSIPQDKLNNPDIGLSEFFNEMVESDNIWLYIDYFETENHVYFTYTENKKRCGTYYDKTSGITSVGSGIEDNMIFGRNFKYQDFLPVGEGENCLYFAVNPIAVLNNEQLPGADLRPDIYNDLTESDNTLIVKLNFRK